MRDIPQDQKTTIGSYHLLRLIQSGPFSRVYLAEHSTDNQQKLAVKVLQALPLEFLGTQQQALLEARRLMLLNQRHILPLLDAGIDEKQLYLVYPYAEGGSLAQRLARTSLLATKEALAILKPVGEALHVAHLQQFVHANLKPDNVLFLSNGEAALGDFRIQALTRIDQNTGSSLLAGASYMAPEQFQGVVTSFSDQYALACLAYQLLTGQPVFQASDVETLAHKHATEQPLSPALARREHIQHLTPVLLKALAKQPEQRYPDVAAFLAALLAPPPLSTLIHTYKIPQVHASSPASLEQEPAGTGASAAGQTLLTAIEQAPLSTPPAIHTPVPALQESTAETQTPDPALYAAVPPTPASHAYATVPPLPVHDAQEPSQASQEQESNRNPRPPVRIPGQASLPNAARKHPRRRALLIALGIALALLASLFASPLLSNTPLFHHIEAQQTSPSPTHAATTASQNNPTATLTEQPTSATHPTPTPVPTRPAVVPTATATPTPVPPTAYEAESAANTLGGNAVIYSCPPCSGGKKVGNLGHGGTLLFNGIRVGKTAAYKITFYFVNGRGDRVADISINGGPALAYTFHGTNDNNWNEVQTMTITVQLTAGTNTLFISNPSGNAPDIDRIIVH